MNAWAWIVLSAYVWGGAALITAVLGSKIAALAPPEGVTVIRAMRRAARAPRRASLLYRH